VDFVLFAVTMLNPGMHLTRSIITHKNRGSDITEGPCDWQSVSWIS